MDTNLKGKITELEVLTYITKLGYSVSIPYGDKDKYDQIWDINGKLIKIQIKTSQWKSKNDHSTIRFKCTSRHMCSHKNIENSYTKDDIDYFATYWDGRCYLIPVEECNTAKYLRFKDTKSGQNLKVSWAKDYEVEKILNKLTTN